MNQLNQMQARSIPAPAEAAQIPDCVYTGSSAEVGGQILPLYEPAPRTDGRPDINTLEGWNLHRYEMSEKRLIRVLHRQPSDAEICEEMERNATCGRRACELIDAGASHEEIEAVFQEYYPEGF